MKRLRLITRLRVAQVVTLLTMLAVAWCVGQWFSANLSWWLALPLAWGAGWFIGWALMVKVQPPIYRWIIRRWILEQPEEIRYLLHLEMDLIERKE